MGVAIIRKMSTTIGYYGGCGQKRIRVELF